MRPSDRVADLVMAGVSVEWLSDPQTRIPMAMRLSENLGRAEIRQTQRMTRAIVAAIDVKEQKRLIEEHRLPEVEAYPVNLSERNGGADSGGDQSLGGGEPFDFEAVRQLIAEQDGNGTAPPSPPGSPDSPLQE